jgi:hypothetical protein
MTFPRRWTPKTTICRSNPGSGAAGQAERRSHFFFEFRFNGPALYSRCCLLPGCAAALLISPFSRRSPDLFSS